MRYEDSSQAVGQSNDDQGQSPIARDDNDALAAGDRGPATGNIITGEGAQSGSLGADVTGGDARITAVRGAGGEDSNPAGGGFNVNGEFGKLSLDANGNYQYTPKAGTPENSRDVFTYTLADRQGNSDTATLTVEIGKTQAQVQANARQVVVGPDGTVILPAGVELSDIMVVGRNLVVTLPDGSQMVIIDGAVFVPQLVLDGVEVPATNLATLLIGQEVQPAAGFQPTQSSGGNFAEVVRPLDPGVPLGDLLPPTEMTYTPPEVREIYDALDREPDVVIQTPDQPVGVENATASVNENALPARSGEPAGSNSASTAETTVGTIVIDSPDSPSVVTINGITVTGVGQVIAGTYGSLTITSISSGAIGYSYTLADNTNGDATQDLFTVVLTDRDGDTDTATLTVSIIDDVPTARPDTDSVAAGSYALATGNVITDAAAGDIGDSDTNAADTVGADNATVSLVSGAGGSDSSFDASGNLVVNGQYGVLTIKADGSYSYARNPNSPGGVNDVFNYTLTDGDGDTSSSTLTISIGDTAPTLRVPATGAGTQVSEAGLPIRGTEPAGSDEAADGNGSDNDVDSETTAGTINFTQGDAPATVAINGIAVTTVGQTFVVTGVGVLTITSIAPGAIGYSFTLTDNTSGDATSVSFAVSVTDADGDVANDNLVIRIIDDVPNANDDSITQATENTPVTINVFANDIPGADGVDVDNNPAVAVNLVAGSLSGSGTLVYNNDGTFTYTPGAGEEGIITFQYRIVDGDGDSDVATVTIQLQPDSIPLVLVAQGSDTIVHEAGLPSRNGEPAGTGEAADGDSTDNDDPRELAAGTLIVTTGTDTVASLVVLDAGGNAVNVTNGGVVQGAYGTLTISGNAIAGYTYSYVLNDNTSGDATSENFGITVTDSDGDTSSTNLIITIVDDAPIAVNDTDSIAAGSYGPAVGNVITDAEGDGGKDNVGADNATISGIASNNVPANSDTSFTAGNLVVNGQYGVLTIAADGSYSYVRNAGTPGGVSDVFTYTLTDGDGDSTTATLTISIADGGVTLDAPDQGEAGTVVSEVGLPSRNGGEPAGTGEAADGNSTDNDDGSETTTGVIAFTAPDGPATVTIDGVAVTGTVGQTFVGAFGTLTITSYNAATGQIGYSYTLADNTSGDATFDDFAIQIIDQDGDVASDTLVIQIIDDAPIAIDDVDSVGEDSQTAADGNVLTGIGGVDGNATDGVRDNVGADNAVVSAVAFGATVGALGTPLAGAYGQLVLNANGSYSYIVNTGLPAVQGLDDGETLTEVFTYTIVDGDGDVDTATLTITINGANDAPVAVSSAVTVSEEGLPGGNPDTTGAPTDTTNSATASGVITISDADGEPLTVTLGIPAGAYTSDGVPVTWALSGNGQVLTGSAGGVPVVTVTIDNTGAYTVVLSGPLDHANAAVEDLAGIVIPVSVSDGTITTPATITLTVEDDSPLVTRSTTGLPTLNVDETNLVQNATASFANAFSVSYGGDGAGSLAYTLSISAAGANSGLIDTATGQAILLYVTAGGVVEGRVGSAAGPIAFAVGVDASGNVTLDQIRAVFHDPNLSANDVEGLSAANLVTLTATAIDADGDSESETVAIGGQLTFTDDGPAITTSVTDGNTVTLTTQDAETDGVPTDQDVAISTANFGGAFGITSSSYGADGAGTTSWNFNFTVANSVSGLSSNGAAINLYLIGGIVVGSTAGSAGAVTAGNTIFTIGVNATSGVVTLTQFAEIDHALPGSGSNYDAQLALLGNGLVILNGTATIVDKDGDSATSTRSLDLGGNIRFADDGPAVTPTGAPVPVLNVDETDLALNASGSFAGLFTIAYGADGPGTTAYSLGVLSAGANSGLIDTATGQAILLYVTAGGVVEGRVGSAAGPVAFAIGVDAAGTVTLDQIRAVFHDPNVNANDVEGFAAANLVTLTATAIDGDGDTASQTANIGNVFTFTDDGPAITATAAADALQVDETNLAVNASANFADNFTSSYGADGAGTVAYALTVSAAGVNSGLIDTATGQAILLYVTAGGVVEGRVGSAAGAVAFTVAVDAAGTVTLDQVRAIVHTPDTGPDQVAGLAAANLINLTATITDKDGDAASATIAIGGALTFKDDGPSISVTAAADALQVDETNLAVNATANYADNFTSAYGADGAGTTVYSMAVSATGANSGLLDTATGQAILLYVNASGLVEGRVGSVGGPIAFTVSINAAGTVTLDQVRAIIHTPDTGPDQVATLASANLISVVATITDKDGDVASSSIGIGNAISFRDDGPSATNDSDAIAVGSNGPATGNVLTGIEVAVAEDTNGSDGNVDAPGADGGRISFIDNSQNAAVGVAVPAGGSTSIAGQFGTLTIFANGDYSYARTPGAGGGQNEVFTYTLTDGDGDSVTATLTISIGDNVPTAGNVNVQLDDDALPGGNPNGTGDDPNSVNASGTLPGSGGDGTLTFSVSTAGAPAGFTYVSGGAGVVLVQQSGTTVLTVTVNANGTYSVVQNAPIMHTAGGDENNATFTVNYTVTDADGDPAPGTISINVDDDTPIVNVTQTNEGGILLTTQDAETDGVPTAEDTAVSTANFGGVFQLSSSPGADGGTATPIAYTLAVTSAVSGLSSHGVAINLYNVGGVIYGSTALSAPTGAADPAVVFSIAVNGTGVVTLTQYQQVDHSVEGVTTAPFDDQFAILANGKISLTASSSLTDGDGDVATDSEVIDLGGNIRFADDGPVATNDSVNQTTENAPITFGVFGNDQFGADGVDTDNNPTVNVTFTQPLQGTVTYNAATGQFTFTPVAGQQGNPTFTYTITDFDGDTSTATVTLNLIPDSTPTAADNVAAVDDDGLAGGNAASTNGDLNANALEEAPVNPSEAIYHGKFTATTGGDTVASFSLAGMGGTSGTVGTEIVNYTWNAGTNTLNATGPRGLLFTVQVNPTTGDYTVTLVDNVLHAAGAAENDAIANLTFRVTDSDGDFDDANLAITFDDDMPSPFTPTSVASLNGNSAPITAPLNLAIGADGYGTLVFDITNGQVATDLNGNVLRVGSQQLYLFGDGTGTIRATTDSTGVAGTIGYTVTLDPVTGTYTFDVNSVISNGTETSFTDLANTKSGNVGIRTLGADNGTNNPGDIDILLSGRSAGGGQGTVNSSQTGIGVDSQAINPGAALRIDIVTGITTNAGQPTGFSYAGHYETTHFEQLVSQTQSGAAVDILVNAILADDDQNLPRTTGTLAADGEVLVAITKVYVDPNGAGVEQSLDITGLAVGSTTAIGTTGVSVTKNANGSVTFVGMQAGDQYGIDTATDFNAVLVEHPGNINKSFDLNIFSVGSTSAGTPIDQNFTVVGTDADGDSVTSQVQTTIIPLFAGSSAGDGSGNVINGNGDNNTIAGNGGDDTLNGFGGNDFLYGNGGNDLLDGGANDDVLRGGVGADSLTGGTGVDTFILSNAAITNGPGNVDIINDYTAGEIIDITEILSVTAATNVVTGQFLRLTTTGLLQVDVDGGGNNWQTVSTVNTGVNTTIRYDLSDGSTQTVILTPVVAPATLIATTSNSAPDSSFIGGFRTLEEARVAANVNTAVMAGAIATVGLAAPVAAEDLGDASSQTTTSITDMQVSKVAADDLDGNDGSGSINRLSTDTIDQSEAIAAPDGSGRSGDRGGDAATFDAAAGHAAGTPDHAANDVDQGPANDMSPASLVAPSIAMPSAEALASAGLAPESKVSGLVEKILADALAGNEHGQTVDALIDAAVGDAGQGAGHALASPMVEHVPAWDMGAGEAGAPIADMMFKMDAMQLHHDAVQPAVNG